MISATVEQLVSHTQTPLVQKIFQVGYLWVQHYKAACTDERVGRFRWGKGGAIVPPLAASIVFLCT